MPTYSAEITVYDAGNGDSSGYEVAILRNGVRVINSYSAGANPLDSQEPGLSSIQTVKAWARETAKDMLYDSQKFEPGNNQLTLTVEKLHATSKG